MRDVKLSKSSTDTENSECCLNYAGCKDALGVSVEELFFSIALTMRDVKTATRITLGCT